MGFARALFFTPCTGQHQNKRPDFSWILFLLTPLAAFPVSLQQLLSLLEVSSNLLVSHLSLRERATNTDNHTVGLWRWLLAAAGDFSWILFL
jgi:hypothetical protein